MFSSNKQNRRRAIGLPTEIILRFLDDRMIVGVTRHQKEWQLIFVAGIAVREDMGQEE